MTHNSETRQLVNTQIQWQTDETKRIKETHVGQEYTMTHLSLLSPITRANQWQWAHHIDWHMGGDKAPTNETKANTKTRKLK